MTHTPATVVSVESTESADLRRIVFSVDIADRLTVPDVADAAVGIYFPDADGTLPPITQQDGVWGFHDLDPMPEGRNYTICEETEAGLVIDFVLHEHGVATTWAAAAQPGDRVVLAHGRSWYEPSPSVTWMLLVADLAGLPAVARIIEELPEAVTAVAVVEVGSAADLAYLPSSPRVQVVPVLGSGNGHGPSGLDAAVRQVEIPAGENYCWLGAEAAESRAVRKYLRREKGWGAEQFDIIGYWRFDSEAWFAKFQPRADELVAVYTQALNEGKSTSEATAVYDEALERAGL
ncbi:siderophore-interacting protein [Dermacoccaceae bacterium W4C1]